MTTDYMKVIGLSRVAPAEYLAQWNGRPIRIMLDTGATLRLMEKPGSDNRSDILSEKADLVGSVAQRLIEMRLEKPSGDNAVVMISALDLDIACDQKTVKALRPQEARAQ